MKAQTHLSHYDEKMYFLHLILDIFQIIFTPFLLWNSVKKSVQENILRKFVGKSKFEICLTVHFHNFFPNF
jgi:hypothetical protein